MDGDDRAAETRTARERFDEATESGWPPVVPVDVVRMPRAFMVTAVILFVAQAALAAWAVCEIKAARAEFASVMHTHEGR